MEKLLKLVATCTHRNRYTWHQVSHHTPWSEMIVEKKQKQRWSSPSRNKQQMTEIGGRELSILIGWRVGGSVGDWTPNGKVNILQDGWFRVWQRIKFGSSVTVVAFGGVRLLIEKNTFEVFCLVSWENCCILIKDCPWADLSFEIVFFFCKTM